MGTYVYENKEYLVYKYKPHGTELILIDDNEDKFKDLLRKYGNVEDISDNEMLEGIFFNDSDSGKRETDFHKNLHIQANRVSL